jgi:tRNA dimethylallyltransferase
LGKVLIIGGPTASGKSTLATQLAQEREGAILNGDSLQVYAGLEIVTDQPSLQIHRNIPHRLYGFLDPTQPYSVGMWLSDVVKAIEEAHRLGLLPIIVGGTGFYLKSLREGLTPIPFVEPHIRQNLEEQDKPQALLYQDLQKVDTQLATRIHPHDHQRTLRGLEVFYGTGKPLSFWQAQKPQPLPYTFETLLCMPSKDDHRAKIAERIETMLARNVLEEIAALLPLSLSATAQKAIGLREFGSYLTGECSLEQAKELTFFHTCQYAKRQRTWFRHQFS